MTPQNANT
jgi:hypothetical protein